MRQRVWVLVLLWGGFVLLLIAGYQANAAYSFKPQYLSDESALCSAVLPRLDMSADGQWMAAVWIQGTRYQRGTELACRRAGGAMLRWTTGTGAANDWSAPVQIAAGHPPTGSCVIHTDVAVTSTTTGQAVAHIVATVRDPCFIDSSDQAQRTVLQYYTYALPGGPLSEPEEVVVTYNADHALIRTVRVALDGDGRPHIVYSVADDYADPGQENGKIYYTYQQADGTWYVEINPSTQAPKPLSDPSTNAFNPEIVWAGGRAHIVWEIHKPSTEGRALNGDVHYAHCSQDAGCWPDLPLPLDTNVETYPYPSVAVQGDRVIVAWNRCVELDSNPPCETFVVLYGRSNDGGETWSTTTSGGKIVGTDQAIGDYVPSLIKNGTDRTDVEYVTFMRPVVALDREGYPWVAWQTKVMTSGASVYVITSTYAISATDASFTWANPGWYGGDQLLDAVASALAVAHFTTPGKRGEHLLYMRSVMVNGTEMYRIYYDYFGDNRVEPDPTPVGGCGEEGCYVYLPLVFRGAR